MPHDLNARQIVALRTIAAGAPFEVSETKIRIALHTAGHRWRNVPQTLEALRRRELIRCERPFGWEWSITHAGLRALEEVEAHATR